MLVLRIRNDEHLKNELVVTWLTTVSLQRHKT